MRDVVLPLAAVAAVAVPIVLLAAGHPVLTRLAVRNALRRRSRLLIVTFGLLIGTAIIASSLTVGDTLEFVFTGQAYEWLDAIDITVSQELAGELYNFPESHFTTLQDEALARGASFDGMAPVLQKVMPVRNEDTIKGNQAITVLGLDEAHEDGFGSLVTRDGRTVSTADLTPGWAYANERAARDLNASSGDRLTLFFGTTNQTLVSVRVQDVVLADGKAAYEGRSLIFLPLAEAQSSFFAIGQINLIKVSAPGPAIGGEEASGPLADDLRRVVGAERWPLQVKEVKRDALDQAQVFADQAVQLFLVMGSFAILAGVLLLVNLFVMLAEERKAEMGVSRAVGLKRLHLTLSFLFEGSLYAALAAVAGALAGVGLGWVMIQIFNAVFPPEEGASPVAFYADPGSVVLAFALGVLITVAAVVVTAAAISRLNITRAIRNLPEPPADRLNRIQRWLVLLTFLGGALMVVRGFELLHVSLPTIDLGPMPWVGGAVLLGGLVGYLAYRVTEREAVARGTWLFLDLAFLAIVLAVAYDAFALPIGADESVGVYRIAGVPLLLLGAATVASRRTSPRLPFTLAGVGVLWWLLYPPIDLVDEARDDLALLFVTIGVLLVLGAILLTMFNVSPLLRGALNRTGRGRPVMRAAVSYPMGKKFRTAMTLAMFALTIFAITVIAMVQGLQAASLDTFVAGQTGGYQVVGYAQGYVPIENFTDELEARGIPLTNFLNGRDGVATATVLSVQVNKSGESTARDYTLWGVDNFLIERNTYDFIARLPSITFWNETTARYEALDLTGREDVWRALRLNRSYAVVDRSAAGSDQFTPELGQLRFNLGDVVYASDGRGNVRPFTILGILEQSLQFTRGIFVDRETVLATYDLAVTRTAYFFQLAPGVNGAAVRADLERAFFEYGLITLDIREEIATQFEASDKVLLLMQAYLALGLLVGITGLGVITVRAVVERRREIGAMRALGFTQRMVRNVFLLEIALIAVLGVVIGMAMGVALAHRVWDVYFSSIAIFTVPWVHLATVAVLSLVATVLITASPALRASKLPPAAALRYIE